MFVNPWGLSGSRNARNAFAIRMRIIPPLSGRLDMVVKGAVSDTTPLTHGHRHYD